VVDRIELNSEHIAENLFGSLMLVTTLNMRIGYDRAVSISSLLRRASP